MNHPCPRCGQPTPEHTRCRRCGTGPGASTAGDPQATLDPSVSTGWGGQALLDDPLGADPGGQSPLELASLPAAPPMAPSGPPEAGASIDPQTARQAQLRTLSRYPEPPRSVLHWVPYFLRVFLQRRIVAEELGQRTRTRRRADRELTDSLCRVGEALYSKRQEPGLATLARHFEVVTQADSDIDTRQETGQRTRHDAEAKLRALMEKVSEVEKAGEPLYTQRSHLQGKLDELQMQYMRHEKAFKGAEQALKQADAADTVALDDIRAKKKLAASDMESTGLAAYPIRDALEQVEGQLRQHQQQVVDLQEETRRQQSLAARQQSRQLSQSGSARSALQAALRSLAESAIEGGLLPPGLATAEAQVASRRVTVAEALAHEAVHREAMESYDKRGYNGGKALLLGGTAAVFTALVARLVF